MKRIKKKKTAKACETKPVNASGVNENFQLDIWMGKRITTVQGENSLENTPAKNKLKKNSAKFCGEKLEITR